MNAWDRWLDGCVCMDKLEGVWVYGWVHGWMNDCMGG